MPQRLTRGPFVRCRGRRPGGPLSVKPRVDLGGSSGGAHARRGHGPRVRTRTVGHRQPHRTEVPTMTNTFHQRAAAFTALLHGTVIRPGDASGWRGASRGAAEIRSQRSTRRMLALAALALGVLATALLGVPAAGAQPAPPSTAAAAGPLTVSIAVQPFGTKTTARVTTSLPTVLKASTASPMGFVEAAAADGGVQPAVGAIRSGVVLSESNYVTEYEFGLPDLTANTTYMVTVDATAQDGQTATATASFTTLKRRVRV